MSCWSAQFLLSPKRHVKLLTSTTKIILGYPPGGVWTSSPILPEQHVDLTASYLADGKKDLLKLSLWGDFFPHKRLSRVIAEQARDHDGSWRRCNFPLPRSDGRRAKLKCSFFSDHKAKMRNSAIQPTIGAAKCLLGTQTTNMGLGEDPIELRRHKNESLTSL